MEKQEKVNQVKINKKSIIGYINKDMLKIQSIFDSYALGDFYSVKKKKFTNHNFDKIISLLINYIEYPNPDTVSEIWLLISNLQCRITLLHDILQNIILNIRKVVENEK